MISQSLIVNNEGLHDIMSLMQMRKAEEGRTTHGEEKKGPRQEAEIEFVMPMHAFLSNVLFSNFFSIPFRLESLSLEND
jgi:hypothetical protein